MQGKKGEGNGGVYFAFLREKGFGRYGFEGINPLKFVDAQISLKAERF